MFLCIFYIWIGMRLAWFMNSNIHVLKIWRNIGYMYLPILGILQCIPHSGASSINLITTSCYLSLQNEHMFWWISRKLCIKVTVYNMLLSSIMTSLLSLRVCLTRFLLWFAFRMLCVEVCWKCRVFYTKKQINVPARENVLQIH